MIQTRSQHKPVIPPSSSLEEDDDWIAEIGEIKTAEDWYKYYPDRCMSNQHGKTF